MNESIQVTIVIEEKIIMFKNYSEPNKLSVYSTA